VRRAGSSWIELVTRIPRMIANVALMRPLNDSGREPLLEEELTNSIIGAFYTVSRILGFGYLESVYAAALERELRKRGHRVAREVLVPVFYLGDLIAYQRLDMVVDDRVIVELKATEQLSPIAERQLSNYLRCTTFEVGLLLHFGPEPKFRRIVHGRAHKPTAQGPVGSSSAPRPPQSA
jgi:GxxExxY protein